MKILFVIIVLILPSAVMADGYSSDQYWRDSRAGAMEREQQQRAWDQEQRAREIEWRQQQLQRQVDNR